MEIAIKSFGDKGDINNERIGFIVLSSCELKYYMVIQTKKTNGGFKNKGSDYFWFLPQQVSENDKVVLYSRSGQNSVKEMKMELRHSFFIGDLAPPFLIALVI